MSALPTPGEAMQQAVERAQLGDIEGGTLWLGIARELRLGEVTSPARPIPRPLDDRGELAAEADLATAGLVPPPVARHAEYEEVVLRSGGVIHLPAERPAYRDSETEVIRYDPAGDPGAVACAYCSYDIGLVFPEDGSPAQWKHLVTKQAVCPVSHPEQSHSFATPALDARG